MDAIQDINALQEIFQDRSIDETLKFLESLDVQAVMDADSVKPWFEEVCKASKSIECEEHRDTLLRVAKKLNSLPVKLVMWLRVSVIYLLTKAKEMGVTSMGDTYADNVNGKLEPYRKAISTVFLTIKQDIIIGNRLEFLMWDEECPVKESKYYDYVGFIIAKHKYLIKYTTCVANMFAAVLG